MANTITLTTVTRGALADANTPNIIQIKVTDSTGAAVANSVVALTASANVGLNVTSVTTNSSGINYVYVFCATAGTYTVTATQTGATTATISTVFTSLQETTAANRVLDTMQSTLIDSSGAGYIGYNSSSTYSSGTLGYAFNEGGVELTTHADKLGRWIDIEDYADTASASGDWTTAIQAALDAANLTGIYDVRGTGQYVVSDTLYIRAVPISGMKVSIYKLSVSSSFPTNTTFWDATPVIGIGQTVGAMVGLELNINYLDGGGVADGIAGINLGFGLSSINIGYASNCIAVVRMGKHQYNSSGNRLTGHYWVNNWIGAFLANGDGTDPIVESWGFDVSFIANNRWGGVWLYNGGQYAKIHGDWDFNGRYLGIIKLSDTTGLSSMAGTTGLVLTDGTTQMDYLFYYTSQGSTYAVVASSTDISSSGTNALPWTAGSTITCTTLSGVALVFTASETAGDNASGTNFFDILHDYELVAFGKIQVMAGYLSGIIGGNQFTSSFQYQNSYSGATDDIRGFGISNSGTALSLYNYALSDTPFVNVTDAYFNLDKKLYMKDRLYEGVGALTIVPTSTTDTTALLVLTNSTNDKYLNEGSMYDITIKSNFATCGSFRVFVVGDTGTYSHVVVSSFTGDSMAVTFSDSTDGVTLNFRQQSGSDMQVVTNIVRI